MVGPGERGSLPSARITGELARRISTGELRQGDTVPSTRQITREYGVAMATATRALTALRQQGLVHVVPGVGTVVGPRPDDEPASAGTSAGATTGTPSSGNTGAQARDRARCRRSRAAADPRADRPGGRGDRRHGGHGRLVHAPSGGCA